MHCTTIQRMTSHDEVWVCGKIVVCYVALRTFHSGRASAHAYVSSIWSSDEANSRCFRTGAGFCWIKPLLCAQTKGP
jgi:hypothetical protein